MKRTSITCLVYCTLWIFAAPPPRYDRGGQTPPLIVSMSRNLGNQLNWLRDLEQGEMAKVKENLEQEAVMNAIGLLGSLDFTKDPSILASYAGLRIASKYWNGKKITCVDPELVKELEQALELVRKEMIAERERKSKGLDQKEKK